MKIFALVLLVGSAMAQIPCPSSEILKPSSDATAQLPRACVSTALPATKSAVLVSDGPSLALAAKCGTTVNLKPGNYGSATLPSCMAGNWLILRAAIDQSIPGGRFKNSNPPSFDHITAGSYTRLGPGLKVISASLFSSTLIDVRNTSHIVILRNHILGTPDGEVGHAIIANSADHIAIVGTLIEEIHCKAGSSGKCADAQGFLAGCGHSGAGFLIENNYIEASTENIIFGGCASDQNATDAIIERNHFFKPLRWMIGQPDYVGTAFTVKNLIEFKNVKRTLMQYNLLENVWGGFSQDGYCILITPKTQAGAPIAEVSDITIRYNKCIAGSGLQFAAARSDPPAQLPSVGTVNASIHDNLFIIDPKFVASVGRDIQATLQDPTPTTQMTGISIINNTFTGAGNAALLLGGQKAGTLIFSNNILWNGKFGAVSNSGKDGDCSAKMNTKATEMFVGCWTTPMLSGNYVIGGAFNAWPMTTSIPTLPPYNPDFTPTVAGVGADVARINANLVP